jgi:arylsulfatase A-like enzyme
VLGRLFDFLKATGLDQSTYVTLSSDNGAALFHTESRAVSFFDSMNLSFSVFMLIICCFGRALAAISSDNGAALSHTESRAVNDDSHLLPYHCCVRSSTGGESDVQEQPWSLIMTL